MKVTDNTIKHNMICECTVDYEQMNRNNSNGYLTLETAP